jgi:hypothetical protein
MPLSDEEAACVQEVLEQAQEEWDEWNREFGEVEKDAGNAERVRSSASPSTSVLDAIEVEWEQSSSADEDDVVVEEEEDKGRGEGEGNQGREQDGAEEETEEESRDKEENGAGGKLVEQTVDEVMKGHAAPVSKLKVDLLISLFFLYFVVLIPPPIRSVVFFSRKGFFTDRDRPYKGTSDREALLQDHFVHMAWFGEWWWWHGESSFVRLSNRHRFGDSSYTRRCHAHSCPALLYQKLLFCCSVAESGRRAFSCRVLSVQNRGNGEIPSCGCIR